MSLQIIFPEQVFNIGSSVKHGTEFGYLACSWIAEYHFPRSLETPCVEITERYWWSFLQVVSAKSMKEALATIFSMDWLS